MLSAVLLLSVFVCLSVSQQTTTLPTSPPRGTNVSSVLHQKNHSTQLLPDTFLHGLTQDLHFTNDWPSSSAAFERPLSKVDLLALKVDQSLMASLDSWLARYGITMPQSVLRTIDEMDLCPPRAQDGMIRKYSCKTSQLMFQTFKS